MSWNSSAKLTHRFLINSWVSSNASIHVKLPSEKVLLGVLVSNLWHGTCNGRGRHNPKLALTLNLTSLNHASLYLTTSTVCRLCVCTCVELIVPYIFSMCVHTHPLFDNLRGTPDYQHNTGSSNATPQPNCTDSYYQPLFLGTVFPVKSRAAKHA